jgi:hypothetical protein
LSDQIDQDQQNPKEPELFIVLQNLIAAFSLLRCPGVRGGVDAMPTWSVYCLMLLSGYGKEGRYVLMGSKGASLGIGSDILEGVDHYSND